MSIIGLLPHQSKDLLAGEQRFSKDNHSTKTIIWQIIPKVLQFVPVVRGFFGWGTPVNQEMDKRIEDFCYYSLAGVVIWNYCLRYKTHES